jgi:hypothetical protein
MIIVYIIWAMTTRLCVEYAQLFNCEACGICNYHYAKYKYEVVYPLTVKNTNYEVPHAVLSILLPLSPS